MNSLRPEFPWKTKLSSAGLVYLHFGERAITEILGLESPTNDVAKIYTKVYENFIEEIDAVDNGIDQYDGTPRQTHKILLPKLHANIDFSIDTK